jgi:hypothetical protein
MVRLRRAFARLSLRKVFGVPDAFALAGVACLAVGVGMIHSALPWLLVGAYLVSVSRAANGGQR